MGSEIRSRYLPSACSASATWIASSRVGTRTSALGPRLAFIQPLDDGKAVGGGFAGASRRLSDHVVVGEQERNCLELDHGRLAIAQILDRLKRSLPEPQRAKAQPGCVVLTIERGIELLRMHGPPPTRRACRRLRVPPSILASSCRRPLARRASKLAGPTFLATFSHRPLTLR